MNGVIKLIDYGWLMHIKIYAFVIGSINGDIIAAVIHFDFDHRLWLIAQVHYRICNLQILVKNYRKRAWFVAVG